MRFPGVHITCCKRSAIRWVSVALLTNLARVAAPPVALAEPAGAKPAAADAQKASSPARDPAVVVGGVVITILDVFLELNRLIPQESYHGTVKAGDQRALVKKALRNTILTELAAQAARKKGIAVARADLDAEYAKRVKEAGGEAALNKLLHDLDLDRAIYLRNIERDLLASRYVAQDYGRPIVISDADLKKYYDSETKRFVQPESVRLSLIEFRADPGKPQERPARKIEAENVRKALAAKFITFADAAKKYSGHESAAKGGDVGWLHRGSLGSEIEGPAFGAPVGEISQLIENMYGFNLFVVTEKRGPKQLQFAEIDKEYWRGELKRLRQREQIERGEDRLLAGVVVSAADPAVDKLVRLRFGTR